MNDDRRDAPRVNRSHRLAFELAVEMAGQNPLHLVGKTLDVSKSGVKIFSPATLPIGLIVEFGLENAEGKMMLLVAEVRWIKPVSGGFEIGLQLLDAEGTDLQPWQSDAF